MIKRTRLKRAPLKRKPKTPEQIVQAKERGEKMIALFQEHWNKKSHYCESCRCRIHGENKTLYHHHCWPKSKYPEYALDIDNLMLICESCHTKTEAGVPPEEVMLRTEQVRIHFKR